MKKIIYLLAFVILSCGARKTQKTETKVTADTEQTTIELKKDSLKIAQTENVSQATSSTETQKTDETSLIFTPIDSTKSIEITDGNGKVFKVKNAKVQRASSSLNKTKSISQNIDTNKIKNTIEKEFSEKKDLSNTTITSETQNKNTEREGFDYFWIILIIGALCAGYLYWNGKKMT
jgi:hypothetical protein